MRGRSRIILPALALATLLIGGCGGPPPVTCDYDTMADWSQYRAFNWLQAPGTEQPNPDKARIMRAVVMDLTSRGYLQGGDGPMMLLSYDITWEGDKDMLTLEMIDEKSKRRLWTATTEMPKLKGTPQEQDQDIQEMVTRMLGYFPPPVQN